MIKNNKGVTLLTTMVMIIIIIILTSVSVNVGYSLINEVGNSKMSSELNMVRQGIIEKYSMARSTNKIEKTIDDNDVDLWIGTRIESSEISMPNASINTSEFETYISKNNNRINNYHYQEYYYYRLTPEDLEKIGVLEVNDVFVVNYSTGEVYNESIKADNESNLLYLPPIVYDGVDTTEENLNDFNDWR